MLSLSEMNIKVIRIIAERIYKMKSYLISGDIIPVPAILLIQENEWIYASPSRIVHHFKEGEIIEVPFP